MFVIFIGTFLVFQVVTSSMLGALRIVILPKRKLVDTLLQSYIGHKCADKENHNGFQLKKDEVINLFLLSDRFCGNTK